jgi:attractin
MAAILWKIKQKYDMFRRRQRLFVEMEQMASRPFSQVNNETPLGKLLHILIIVVCFQSPFQVLVELDTKDREYNEITPSLESSNLTKKRKKDSPSPIALEPCIGNKAAVLSLLVRMPTGEFRISSRISDNLPWKKSISVHHSDN